jgi:hypothetical protein
VAIAGAEATQKVQHQGPIGDRLAEVADDVLELDGDGSVEPGEDHGVHQGPGPRRRGGDVIEDVVVEGVAPQGEKDLSPPARVVGGRQVQNDGHEGPDVL